MSVSTDFSQLASVGLPTLLTGNNNNHNSTPSMNRRNNNTPTGGGIMNSTGGSSVGVDNNNNSGGNPLVSWNRSLKELKIASDSLWTSAGQRGGPQQRTTTFSNLSSSTSTTTTSGGGANRLSELERLTDSLETKVNDDYHHHNMDSTINATTEGFSSVEDTIRNHEIHILDRILKQEEDYTRQKSQDMLELQLQNDWSQTIQTYCKELVGTRMLGGLQHAQQQKEQQQQIQQQPQGYYSGSTGMLPPTNNCNTQMIQDNLQILSTLNRSIHNNDGQINATILMEAISNMQKLADPVLQQQGGGNTTSTTSSSTPQQSCYSTAWKYVSSMVERNPFTSTTTTSSNATSPIQNGMAAIILLCAQFQSLIMDRVSKSNLALGGGQQQQQQQQQQPPAYSSQQEQIQYVSSLANTISTFVKLEIGSTSSSSYPWPEIYYSLRSGDAIAAKEILYAATAYNNDMDFGPVLQIVSHLAKHQGSHNVCFWLSGIPILSRQDRQNIADIYERFKNRIMEENNNNNNTMDGINNDNHIHKLGTLSLLCGLYDLPTSNRISGFSTIEDYLFSALCKAMNSGSGGNSGGEEQIIQELVHVGNRIQQLGPNYFEDHESGGWSYALPLLLTQQYHTALVYLADNGGPVGVLQATHIGMILSLLSNTTTTTTAIQDLKHVTTSTALTIVNPEGGSNNNSAAASTTTNSECLVTALIVAYSTLLQTQFPPLSTIDGGATVVPALEYLVRIPNRARIRKEVATLIMRSNDLTKLTGTLSQDGKRIKNSGALDIHFSELEIASILVESAEVLYKDINDNKKCQTSATLFMLAGHYRSVLLLLNQLISPIDKASLEENKRFWFQQTKIFHETYLEKRTHVLELLEKEGNMNLVSTSRMLMGLYYFFDYYYQGAFDQAMGIINNDHYQQQMQMMQQQGQYNINFPQSLDLLPTSKSELSSKESRFHGLDPLIQQCFPMILKCSMEILNHQHRRVKSELHLGSGSGNAGGGGGMFGVGMGSFSNSAAAQQRLIEIKEQAGLLIAFAGLLPNVAGENIDSMTRMEALMI